MRDNCCSVFVGESSSLCNLKRQLVVVDRCLPVSQPCDSVVRPYYTSLSGTSLNNPAAEITVVNESQCSGCTMTVIVNGTTVAVLTPEGSISSFVPCLDTIEIACATDPNQQCTGFIQADLFVRVRI